LALFLGPHFVLMDAFSSMFFDISSLD
jgi:hypothetical protein